MERLSRRMGRYSSTTAVSSSPCPPRSSRMRPAAARLLVLLVSPSLGAQRPASAPAAAPADAWRQFRGTPNLTGVSASVPPATLNVLWSYDTKDVIDSSA